MLRYITTKDIWRGEPIAQGTWQPEVTTEDGETVLGPPEPFMVRHPSSIEQAWSDEELAAIGLERVPEPPPVEPARFPFVDKYVAIRRVQAAGKGDELGAMLLTYPLADRLVFEAAPFLACDDPAIRAAVASLGLDPDVILAPTTWRRSVAEA